ncbi:MAG: hypothetical protein KC503_20340 [Myxococcales bacterium]|nr:hypothetical protein [Myxococcales bacterium]
MSDAKALLSDLERSPDDDALRTRAARALDDAGEPGRAVALLGERFVNLTAHEGPPLPCLCKRCLKPDSNVAASDGVEFRRDFATRDGRVLYFWVPTELFGARGLRESVVKRMKVSTSRRSLG